MTAKAMLPNLNALTPEEQAVAAAIAIPAHVVEAKGHGHAGTAMALAPLSHVLFSRVLRHSPSNPEWEARDRFVLSAGHASLLLYVQLFLSGYGVSLADLAASRTLGSLTPGHPEYRHTVGVEMSTGPLGQGVASAVGMALAGRRESAVFAAGSTILDHTIWVLAGDGCLQEGVSSEASSLAGTLGLDNLVVIWDDNSVTIDGPTSDAFAEDVRARYRAYGWRVLDIADPTDLDGIERTLREAADRATAGGRPTLVALRSVIGAPSRRLGGQPAAHSGGFGADDVADVKRSLGFASDATLEELVTDEALAFGRGAVERGRTLEADWRSRYDAWAGTQPAAASRWRDFRDETSAREGARGVLEALAESLDPHGDAVATRKTNGRVIQALHSVVPLWGGSADLSSSTNVSVPGEAVTASHPGGDFIRFGIREHAMAAILNGIALHGRWRAYGSTYLVFSDYMRPSIRLAALMRLPVIYVFTHDSVAVGEDGPTHQPVEQIASLRTVPGLDVVRPGDAFEVLAVWQRMINRPAGPTVLVLSRQDLPVLSRRVDRDSGPDANRDATRNPSLNPSLNPALTSDVAHGGYVAWQSGDGLDLAVIATGSELTLAMQAAELLSEEGVGVRVVSMPCVEWFIDSGQEWIDAVLPSSITARVAVEAGRGDGWWRWVGTQGEVLGVETFGESGSGPEIMALHGMTVTNVVAAAKRTLARS